VFENLFSHGVVLSSLGCNVTMYSMRGHEGIQMLLTRGV
jgi:hypothetical protein